MGSIGEKTEEEVGNMRAGRGKVVHSLICAAALFALGPGEPYATAQLEATPPKASTFCNPLNLDYTYKITESDQDISYRSGADPAVVGFRGGYYMFVTRALGYWYSKDLTQWRFITPQRWYFQGENAPAAHNYRDELLYVTGDPSGTMSLLYTDDPQKGDWQAVPALLRGLQDPDFFIDDDGRAFLFWGSSNRLPIRGEGIWTRSIGFLLKKVHRLNCSIATKRSTGGSGLEKTTMIPS